MCFVSECCHLDLDTPAATLGYSYPDDHPFTKGHFPGNPVMMGITQWIGASDALDWLAFALIEAGNIDCPAEVTANVVLQRPDGTLVAEVSGLRNSYSRASNGRLLSETVATKRIGFRDMVKPGDELIHGVTTVA